MELAEIEAEESHRVAEGMAHGPDALMPDFSTVDSGLSGHNSIPNPLATSTAERTASSWNP